MKKYIFIIFLAFLSCQNERTFEWTEDLKQTVGTDLEEWLKKSPFDGVWNEKKGDKDVMVFDNRQQVFPFMGKFKNENDNFRDYKTDGDVYKKETILYKDTRFGESFVFAALLYEPQELFLEPTYSEMGSVILSGQGAMDERYYAQLAETMIYSKNKAYKTAIYWVDSNQKEYLFGFYQRGKLIFEFAFPCSASHISEGVKQIKAINDDLGLNIKEWAQATGAQLAINNAPGSFWKDPFVDIYYGAYMLPEVQVKIKNTDFKALNKRASRERDADYTFVNEKNGSVISFKKEKTDLTAQAYADSFKDQKQIPIDGGKQLYITKEELANGQNVWKVESYFKDNYILTIEACYPENDTEARKQMMDVLQNLKFRLL